MNKKQETENALRSDIGDDTIIIIKLSISATALKPFRENLIRSQYEKTAQYTVQSTGIDLNTVNDLSRHKKEYRCAVFDFEKKTKHEDKDDTEDHLKHLYWVKAVISDDNSTIDCDLLFQSDARNIINNFAQCISFDLGKDFEDKSYIAYASSKPLLEQMQLLEKANCTSLFNYFREQQTDVQSRQEKLNEAKDILSKQEQLLNLPRSSASDNTLIYKAQGSETNLSPLAQKNENCTRQHNIRPADTLRGEFQRDYDRILYSKAFRRMVDKAQIFSSTKGDHYRTRMTHTLIVCQIARSIAIQLNLNRALTEAIAIGHDLGHTPFGHQGERTLNEILNGSKDFYVDGLIIDEGYPYGGFKHNFQGVRVASCLEDAYFGIQGMDLSLQTLDGIWKHTKINQGQDIRQFSSYKELCDQKSEFPITLEGQVVAVADEIAQRSHDIDDALSSSLIKKDDLISLFSLIKFEKLQSTIQGLNNERMNRNTYMSDQDELFSTRLSAEIVKIFVEDVVESSRTRMKAEEEKLLKGKKNEPNIYEKFIDFSDVGKRMSDYMKNILNKKVLDSEEVVTFDDNASTIVYSLFKIYYKNPMLLHDGTLRRLYQRYLDEGITNVFRFRESDPDLMRAEWATITRNPIKNEGVNNYDMIVKKRKLLVRTICDYIAGMTDSYAEKEYRKHYRR